MNHGLYELKQYLTDEHLNQILIPEIQRDYVWKKSNVINLLSSIAENARKKLELDSMITDDSLDKIPSKLKEVFLKKVKQDQPQMSTNIGFIYAYSDKQINGQYILIDGQQRLTTIFLLLLCLAVKEKKTHKFRQSYFFDKNPKIDYKVRESSHDFLKHFVDFLLEGNSFDALDDQYWYSGEYEYDLTILFVKKNYQCIQEYLNDDNDITYDYVESNIEFWYFDTDLSMQGEELYLYMNSRGETVTQTESIKARLIKKLESEEEKHCWGKKWEFWQDFFWKNRSANTNSDIGMKEFLRCISIIEKVRASEGDTVEKTSVNIRRLCEEDEIDMGYLNFDTIDKYFRAIEKIKALNLIGNIHLNFEDAVFSKTQSTIGYFRLLPVIMYLVVYYENADSKHVLRYGRFFCNLSKNQNISKDPHSFVVNAIRITVEFLDRGYSDVTNLINFAEKYDSLLTREELAKLKIFKNNSDIREDIENSFWNAEDDYFCSGSLAFLFRCMKYDISDNTFSRDKLELFDAVFLGFSTLLKNRDDLLRRALLTKGDYKVERSYSTTYEVKKYSFLYNIEDWKKELAFEKSPLLNCFENLLVDYIKYWELNGDGTRGAFLESIIDQYDIKNSKYEWISHFIEIPEILHSCGYKLVCFGSNDLSDIILLSGINASVGSDEVLQEIVVKYS